MDKMEQIRNFLHAQPKDAFLRHALALEHIKRGEDPPARELFETILTDFPDYVGSYYHLAKLIERNGEIPLAIDWYEKGMAVAKKLGDRHAYSELQMACDDLTD
jgi:Tfp pilus assembly protein PilF